MPKVRMNEHSTSGGGGLPVPGKAMLSVESIELRSNEKGESMSVAFSVVAHEQGSSEEGKGITDYFQLYGRGVGRTYKLIAACGLLTDEQVAAYATGCTDDFDFDEADLKGNIVYGDITINKVSEEDKREKGWKDRTQTGWNFYSLNDPAADGYPKLEETEGGAATEDVGEQKEEPVF